MQVFYSKFESFPPLSVGSTSPIALNLNELGLTLLREKK